MSDTAPQITFTTTAGQPITSFPGDFPVVVQVTLPEGTPPPETIDVDLSTPSDTETVRLAWTGNARGAPVYRSNPLTLEAGAVGGGTLTVDVPLVGGFTWTTGDMDPVSYSDGDTLTATFGDVSTTSTVFDSWHTLTIDQATKWLDVQESFWSKLLESLPPAGEDPDADPLREQAQMKLDAIARARQTLANDKLWMSQRAAAARFYVSWIQNLMPGETDLRDEAGILHNTLERAKEESMDVILQQFTVMVLGFYDVFTHATMAAQVVEVFGMDIYGKELKLSDRILAAIDLASGFAMETAGILGAHRRMKQGNVDHRPLIELNLPDPITGVKNVPTGTAVPHGAYGILDDGFVHMRGVADEFGVTIEVRPANVDSMRWQELGHPRKPMKIKQKTINELDTHLGANPDDIGLVGYFDPTPPVRQPGMSDQLWGDIQKRYAQRKKEFEDGRADLGHLVDEGKVRLENGTIVDTGLCGDTGLPITGDYDIWRITRDGKQLDAVQAQPIIDRLQAGPAQVQHGAHCNWDVPDSQRHIDEKIRTGHKTEAQGGEGETLLAVGGRTSGPARATYSGIDVVPGRPIDDLPTTPTTRTSGGAADLTGPGVRAGVRGAVAGAGDGAGVGVGAGAGDDGVAPPTSTGPNLKWMIFTVPVLVLVAVLVLMTRGGNDDSDQLNVAGASSDAATTTSTTEAEPEVAAIPAGWDTTVGVLRELGLTDAAIASFLGGAVDDTGELVWSISSEKPGDQNPSVDLTRHAIGRFTIDDPALLDRVLPPGVTDRGTVACGPTPPAAGEWVVVASQFAAPVSEADGRNGFAAIVFDSDGRPDNNFAFQPPFDWDLFRDTDRWYAHDLMRGRWSPALELSDLTQTAGRPRMMPTAARTFVSGADRLWFIPMSELPSPSGLRLASFGQLPGPLDPATSAGDVSGADPTAPLAALPSVSSGSLGGAAASATTTTVSSTTPPSTTAAPTTTAAPSGEARVGAFLERFNAAADARDAGTAFDLLHPAVLDRYGADQCRSYLESTFGTARDFVARSVAGPKDVVYTSDGMSTTIENGFEVAVDLDANGTPQSTTMRLADSAGSLRWFTDCGTPR